MSNNDGTTTANGTTTTGGSAAAGAAGAAATASAGPAGLLTEIDHVAIAVRDLEAAIDYYAETFGATVAHRERIESDGVEEALIKVADSYIQLLTPTSDSSPVAKYLEKRARASTTWATGWPIAVSPFKR